MSILDAVASRSSVDALAPILDPTLRKKTHKRATTTTTPASAPNNAPRMTLRLVFSLASFAFWAFADATSGASTVGVWLGGMEGLAEGIPEGVIDGHSTHPKVDRSGVKSQYPVQQLTTLPVVLPQVGVGVVEEHTTHPNVRASGVESQYPVQQSSALPIVLPQVGAGVGVGAAAVVSWTPEYSMLQFWFAFLQLTRRMAYSLLLDAVLQNDDESEKVFRLVPEYDVTLGHVMNTVVSHAPLTSLAISMLYRSLLVDWNLPDHVTGNRCAWLLVGG
jgi:hypothetical protein